MRELYALAQVASAHVDVARRRAKEGAAGALPSLQAAWRLLPSDAQLANALAGSLRALERQAEAAEVLRSAVRGVPRGASL